MKLSIIVPMYNTEKYIGTCLKSLISQDIPSKDYEILVINDGSRDNSKNIVDSYIKRYSNIRIISVENGGQSKARNIGIDNAKGDYLFFVDSDDYISINSLKDILEKSIKNDLDMMFFDLKQVYDENKRECGYKNNNTLEIKNGIQYFADNNVNNGPWHYLISRNFIRKNNLRFIEGKFCEDGMFLISSIFEAKRVAYSNVDVYRYVMRSNSTTTQKKKEHLIKMVDDFMFAIDYINNYYKKAINQNYPDKFIKRLESRRNSYIYFMQIRMIKAKVGRKYAKEIIKKLKKIDCYKYKRMSKSEYADFKTTLIWSILNSRFLFCFLCA